MTWEYNNTHLNPSNEIILVIDDAVGKFYDSVVSIHDITSGQRINPWTSGIIDAQQHTAPGEVTITLPNSNAVGPVGARAKFAI